MGILDDAIREHLELKRRHGAESDDLERLEKEAFGPPNRPGEEDESLDTGAEAVATEASEAETTMAPLPDSEREPAPEEASEGRRIDWFEEFESEEQPLPAGESVERSSTAGEEEQPAEAISPAERSRDEAPAEPALAEEDAEDDSVEGEATIEPAGQDEPAAPPEAAIFDQDDEVDFDLDLDLDMEGEEGAEPATGGEDLGEEAAAVPPSEELDLTLGEDTPDRAAEGEADEEGEEEGEDLLEETPDFLEDTPEGERLWFEQNPPQEFDFEDEDEEGD
jgi:hypothetical protein